MSRQISVLVYGDCPELQACEPNVEITVSSAEDLQSALDDPGKNFELALIEATPGDRAALQAVRRLYRTAPGCATVMIAEPDALDVVEAAIEAGLTDYVIRAAGPDRLAPLVTHTVERALRHASIKQRFHESERRFWTFFDHAPMGLVVMSPEGRIEHANSAFTDMVGYSLDELRSMSVRQLLADDELDVWEALQRELEKADRDLLRLGQKFIHADGDPRWAETSCVVMRDHTGAPAYILGMATDETDRRHIQQNLEHADKMQAMGRLAGGVAHDFNNLLTIIESHCFIMQDALDNPDKLNWSIDRISQATERGSKLTRQLLTFGRSQPGDTETVNPNELFEEMSVVLDSLFGKTVEVEISADDDLRNISVNQNDIEQVVTNLALNARDAMPDGGRFEIRTYNLSVDVPSSAVPADLPRGQYTVIEISDTGVGMAPDVQKKAFEPFFTTKDVGEGTGLGLSTVYGVVNQNNGYVTLDSKAGEGTTFTIYFPSAQQESETPPKLRRARKNTPTHGSETILLVEDEEELRLPLKDLLDQKGYEVLVAADGEEALSLSRQYTAPIDLLLTDVIMPGLDGVSLADRITEQRAETSVILMSGYTADALSMNSDPARGERKLLQKPFGMDILSRTIRQTLSSPS